MIQAKPEFLNDNSSSAASLQPSFYRIKTEDDALSLKKLIEEKKVHHVIDRYENQLEELFGINNPSQVYTPEFKDLLKQHLTSISESTPLWQQGVWVYFPWRASLVHILEEDDYQKVRFARNQNLITAEEQQRFYNSTIGIAGLSVGNSVALAIVLEGGAKRIKLADFDRLDLSNLNRIRSGVHSLGLKKVEMTARQIYELNPYAQIELFDEGLTAESIESFFDDTPKLDIIIDEIDTLAVKYLIRKEAKKRKIPVLMAADNGENGLLDIERYDQEDVEYFHGRIPGINEEMLQGLSKFETGKLIAQHIGFENIPYRMFTSLNDMGKTIVSWPQLGGPAIANGTAIAYCVRRILNNQPLENVRSIISFDKALLPNEAYEQEIKQRDELLKNMM